MYTFDELRSLVTLNNSARAGKPTKRRSFIGGSDARIIMGNDEARSPAPLAGKARRGRA